MTFNPVKSSETTPELSEQPWKHRFHIAISLCLSARKTWIFSSKIWSKRLRINIYVELSLSIHFNKIIKTILLKRVISSNRAITPYKISTKAITSTMIILLINALLYQRNLKVVAESLIKISPKSLIGRQFMRKVLWMHILNLLKLSDKWHLFLVSNALLKGTSIFRLRTNRKLTAGRQRYKTSSSAYNQY
jgi:hypothetical protein